MAGMPVPVSPLRRFEHYFTCGNPMERLPYVKDLARMAFRSEGSGFSGGVVDGDEPRGINFEVDHGYFERVVWPAAAHRFPPLESAKCHRTWAGLYEQCGVDGNPVIGNWPGVRENLHACTGFSGHGTTHAPAAGRAIAERIVHGEDRSYSTCRAFPTGAWSRTGPTRSAASSSGAQFLASAQVSEYRVVGARDALRGEERVVAAVVASRLPFSFTNSAWRGPPR